jgi:Fe-S cluster assembly iron-binding protein IscA
MIQVTPDAARQIRVAAATADAEGLALRIAARRDADGSLHYAMGFDEARSGDVPIESEGIALVVSPDQAALVDGMTIDYVELVANDFRFIFINPNDPTDGASGGHGERRAGCGSGGCGCKG